MPVSKKRSALAIDPGKPVDFETMNLSKKLLRQAFVREYMKDFCGKQAVLRMGYNYKQPCKLASEWLDEPYTQHYLQEMLERADEKELFARVQIVAGLAKEATAPDKPFSANAATRVAALKQLAKIKGMEIVRHEGTLAVSGGVMAIPLATSLEEWEAATLTAQQKLKEAVRT